MTLIPLIEEPTVSAVQGLNNNYTTTNGISYLNNINTNANDTYYSKDISINHDDWLKMQGELSLPAEQYKDYTGIDSAVNSISYDDFSKLQETVREIKEELSKGKHKDFITIW